MRLWGWTLLVVLGVGAGWVYNGLQPVTSGAAGPVMVEVPAGLGSLQVGQKLAASGVVRDAVVFALWARVTGQSGHLQAGQYMLSPGWRTSQVIQELAAGDVLHHHVTIPEGYSFSEIAQRLGSLHGVTPAAVTAAAAKLQWPSGLGTRPTGASQPAEGLLFPDTYEITDPVDLPALVLRMAQREFDLWTPDRLSRARTLALTPWQVLTLASIVEAEAKLPTERPIIAGVYLNRLHQEMKLDADPTVRYALHLARGMALQPAELNVDSPYNTYRVKGLPPGPICSPGQAAVDAVLHAAPTDALYFVARQDGSGGHYFARTLQQQEENIRKSQASAQAK